MSVLLRRREGSVEILTLNRPQQRNALTPELMEALSSAFQEALDAPDVRVVVLTGAGDKAFCAGMDLKAFSAGGSTGLAGSTEHFDAFIEGRFAKPVIAAVNATALAGGFELMLSCDLAVVSREARFGLPEVKYGLFAAGGGVLLPARIPLALALELGLTGDSIDAERALALGLANRLVEPQAVLATALQLAERIAANAPLALTTTKQLMRACVEQGASVVRAQMPEAIKRIFASEDAHEGAQAFIERRPPCWRGR